MTFNTLIFDLDGTLLDTLQDLADSTNYALSKHGFSEHPAEAYRYFVGSGARELIRRALPETQRQDAIIEEVLATYKLHYQRNWNHKTALYDGIADLLDAASARGLRLAILTNKPQDFALDCVQHFLGNWTFDKVQGQVDGMPHKPSVQMSAQVTDALNVAPDEVLYLGDSDIDMHTAANAGFTSVGVTWGFRSAAELTSAGAMHLIDHPSELLPLLR